MRLLPNIPYVTIDGKVTDSCYNFLETITQLDNEAKRLKKLSLKCSQAAYRSRIVQATYIYNSMVSLIKNSPNESEESIKIAEEKVESLYDEITSMWEGHREW